MYVRAQQILGAHVGADIMDNRYSKYRCTGHYSMYIVVSWRESCSLGPAVGNSLGHSNMTLNHELKEPINCMGGTINLHTEHEFVCSVKAFNTVKACAGSNTTVL